MWTRSRLPLLPAKLHHTRIIKISYVKMRAYCLKKYAFDARIITRVGKNAALYFLLTYRAVFLFFIFLHLSLRLGLGVLYSVDALCVT